MKKSHTTSGAEQKVEPPPTMQRSRTQLATAYAPGSLFTFEGGQGACMSVSTRNEPAPIKPSTELQIYEQIKEYVESWAVRARNPGNSPGSGPLKHETPLDLCVDQSLLNGNEIEVSVDKFAFMDATRMGYVPFPLSFICRRCGLHRTASDVGRVDNQARKFREHCPNGASKCANDWEQLDVVMVHWSGRIEPLTPSTRFWTQDKIVPADNCRSCGNKDFMLRRNSASFSDWYFVCTKCGMKRDILQKDEFTLQRLTPHLVANQVEMVEVNMEPVSYRASAAFYSHGDRLIIFSKGDQLELIQHGCEEDLIQFLGEQYNYPGKQLTDAEKGDKLRAVGKEADWKTYCDSRNTLAMMEKMPGVPAEGLAAIRTVINQYEEQWTQYFLGTDRASPQLRQRVYERSDYIRRYDPIRMAVEHKAFADEKLFSGGTVSGKLVCVPVGAPDVHLMPTLPAADKQAVIREIRRRLDLLGFADMRLIRNLELCEYTFGYTRVSALPLVEREKTKGNKVEMPVRLNLFGRTDGGQAKHPVYCIKQENEAFYVQLKEEIVLEWLRVNGMAVDLGIPPINLGGRLIEEYPANTFSRFLDDYRREKNVTRAPYPYIYTLLHTIAHQLVCILSELSGLDLGSFGEHLFVPDLAFLVYRRGTTMDLGNLSSMWRNYTDPAYGNQVLEKMVLPENLRCGSETVCLMRGGACPDCILLPETSCLTRNELLSRSILTGRGLPSWDDQTTPLAEGFYNVSRRLAVAP